MGRGRSAVPIRDARPPPPVDEVCDLVAYIRAHRDRQPERPFELVLGGPSSTNPADAGIEPPEWALQPIPEVTVVGPQIAAQQGSEDPNAWRSDAERERIKFSPINVQTMRYTNRPSGIQQVISFKGHRPKKGKK